MHSHAAMAALTLYRSETLTLAQASTHAGCTEAEFRALATKHGVEPHEEPIAGEPESADPTTPVRAD